MLKKLLFPVALGVLLVILGLTLTQKKHAPETRFFTLSGAQLTSSQLRGKVVLINFWATSCSGCIAEMPRMVEMYTKLHPQGFELVAVAMPYDEPDHVRAFSVKHALPFDVALDTDGSLTQAFNDVRLTPTAILIDKEGNIVSTIVGEADFASLTSQITRELGRTG